MSSNLGLFHWIREGVRQSVLLGVSDALESVGNPDQSGNLHPALLSISSPNTQGNLESNDSTETNKRSYSSTRKRLGRSLKDIEPVAKVNQPTS